MNLTVYGPGAFLNNLCGLTANAVTDNKTNNAGGGDTKCSFRVMASKQQEQALASLTSKLFNFCLHKLGKTFQLKSKADTNVINLPIITQFFLVRQAIIRGNDWRYSGWKLKRQLECRKNQLGLQASRDWSRAWSVAARPNTQRGENNRWVICRHLAWFSDDGWWWVRSTLHRTLLITFDASCPGNVEVSPSSRGDGREIGSPVH